MENMDEIQPVQPTPTPSMPSSSPSEPAKKWHENKKIKIAIILSVLIVISLAIFAYFAFTKSNQPVITNPAPVVQAPTQEWTTYKDDKFGFSIDYPKDWGFVANALGSGGNGGANYVFCPPENMDTTDSGMACKVRTDNLSVPNYQSPIIYLSSWSKSEFKGDLTKEGVWLSTDGNYVYELRASGADAYSDIYKQMISTFKFKEKPKAGEVTWSEAKKLDDLKIFVPYTPTPDSGDDAPGFKAFESSYYQVGHIDTGKYAGADIITALYGKHGSAYTLLKYNGNYKLLTKYEYTYTEDNSNFAATPDIDEEYDIPELDYTEQIISPTKEIVYRNTVTAMSFDPNFDKSNLNKKLSTDPKWGTVYDNSDDSSSYPTIGILLPNGAFISYAMGDIASPEIISSIPSNTSFNNGQTWDNYKAESSFCSVWNESEHAAYYELANLQKVGDIYGLPFYEMTNKALLKTLYTDMDGGNAEPFHPGIKGVSLATFITDHPLIVGTDPYGRKFAVMNKKYSACLGGAGKPVIYLYPEKEEKVSVKVQTPGPMTVSIPDYNGGWNVSAKPDGTLTELVTEKKYPYLFWESKGGNGYSMPGEGFNVVAKDLQTFFESTLARYGLSDKEREDFKEFWVPRLESKKSPYYFITFTTTEGMQKYAPLTINPQPDTLIRVFMDYRLISSPISAKEPHITTPVRKGFTAIEWGGALK